MSALSATATATATAITTTTSTGKVVREMPCEGSPERVSHVWYGWDGDRLTTTQTDTARIQTVYLPGSFTPLLRIETATAELQKATRRSLAEKLQQDGGVTFPPELVTLLDSLEGELRSGHLSAPFTCTTATTAACRWR